MKRVLSLLIVLSLFPVIALADLPDVSGLSFDELIELRHQVNIALWKSEEWQEVVVPIGVYKIGEDIPVGKWTISSADTSDYSDIYLMYTDVLDASGMDISFSGSIAYYTTIAGKSSESMDEPKSVDLDCKKNCYIIIKYGPALFTPFVGKPDLGFK